jgi:hypothetical protein
MDNAGWSTYAVPVFGGEPRLVLSNAAGLSWLDRDHVIFSEVKQGQHMGIVAGPENRTDLRELYFPLHERGMAHYAFPSPDRTSAIVAEMDDNGGWLPCRLIGLTATFPSRQIGPDGACRSAAWSRDGTTAYFSAQANGGRHLWRQHLPNGAPEQITSGATTEVGVAVDPDDGSLVTSIGAAQGTLWFHHADGEQQLSSEGEVIDVSNYSADGQYVYYAVRRDAEGGRRELRRMHLTTGRSETLLPGTSIGGFDISADGTRALYTAPSGHGPQIWIAALDGGSPPRAVGNVGDRSPFFGPNGDVLFCFTEGKFNYLGRMHADGTGRTKVVPYPISNITGVSPGHRWVMAIAPLLDQTTVGIMAVPVGGGDPVRICEIYCHTSWSTDGKFLFASVEESSLTSPGRSLAIPVGPDETLPAFPAHGLPPQSQASVMSGARSVPRSGMLPGADPDTFLYIQFGVHRNLFRITLPR